MYVYVRTEKRYFGEEARLAEGFCCFRCLQTDAFAIFLFVSATKWTEGNTGFALPILFIKRGLYCSYTSWVSRSALLENR